MGVKEDIQRLANQYTEKLKAKIDRRIREMEKDDVSHFFIYRVLGVTDEEGKLIDKYQNKGRFLYKYAGSFLEEAAMLCFKYRYPNSKTMRIPNTEGQRPKNFQIDCVIDKDAIEVKWRDATTDGDHITKEHTRLRVVHEARYTPVRVMFYYPNRDQAIKIQQTLETLYHGVGGQYYYGDKAWNYVKNRTNIDLKQILEQVVEERIKQDES